MPPGEGGGGGGRPHGVVRRRGPGGFGPAERDAVRREPVLSAADEGVPQAGGRWSGDGGLAGTQWLAACRMPEPPGVVRRTVQRRLDVVVVGDNFRACRAIAEIGIWSLGVWRSEEVR